ncbi:hypothetical protein N7462_000492 [Penicillium macrosclerotiorum]|uniref:uncharacterized protein n=1 Tax=Penicillium macrosclerotiorum TaxID=303699 RepID=UPI0025496FBE|nr:uncharacterized protein N7462_000492 [Penicillium macrosclerotiorum]KAJ5698487.1 hypothetical protein N7462_000492 [Penicillium macrosclerotiorum]
MFSKLKMLKDPSPDLTDPDYEENERLLAEEQGQIWSGDYETDGCHSLASSLLQFTLLGIFFLVGTLLGFFWRGDLDGLCSQHVSQYSPIIKEVGISYHLEDFNGSLLRENIFRQDAGPDVDAAWESLGVNYQGVRVSKEEAIESGIAVDQVRIQEKYGGGYLANVEGLHHLHCLNLLRQSLYYNYDYYHSKQEGLFEKNDYIIRHHVSHCLDVLRHQLMCTVDTGVLGHVWIYPENPEPFLDLNTRHRCKNFEDVRQWAEENQLPEKPPEDFLQRPTPGGMIYTQMP